MCDVIISQLNVIDSKFISVNECTALISIIIEYTYVHGNIIQRRLFIVR